MRINFKIVGILFLLSLLLLVSCDENSVTESVLGENSVEVTGNLNTSFNSKTIAGLYAEDTLSVFTIMMQDEGKLQEMENILVIAKESDAIPSVGTYSIDVDQFNPDSFHATYTQNDSIFYLMTTGTVDITKSSATKIEGKFSMSGTLFSFDAVSDKEISVSGKFSTIPVDL